MRFRMCFTVKHSFLEQFQGFQHGVSRTQFQGLFGSIGGRPFFDRRPGKVPQIHSGNDDGRVALRIELIQRDRFFLTIFPR